MGLEPTAFGATIRCSSQLSYDHHNPNGLPSSLIVFYKRSRDGAYESHFETQSAEV